MMGDKQMKTLKRIEIARRVECIAAVMWKYVMFFGLIALGVMAIGQCAIELLLRAS